MFIWSQIKSFHQNLFLTSNLKTSFEKVSQYCQLNSNMSKEKLYTCSFGHKLSHFVSTYSWPKIKKMSFRKVSTIDQLNTEMISENWNLCSFGHKLSHFVRSCSWPPLKKLQLQKFINVLNSIRICPQKNYKDVQIVFN